MEKINFTWTWEELVNLPSGTILLDTLTEDGYRLMIMRCPNSLCAYIGVTDNNILFGKDYSEVDFNCHWGLNFSKLGTDDNGYPKDYWWFGWSYDHLGDYCFYFDTDTYFRLHCANLNNKKWLFDEVQTELFESLDSFKNVVQDFIDDYNYCVDDDYDDIDFDDRDDYHMDLDDRNDYDNNDDFICKDGSWYEKNCQDDKGEWIYTKIE